MEILLHQPPPQIHLQVRWYLHHNPCFHFRNISSFCMHFYVWFNSLWPSDAIWRHRTGSTLDQVMACCLTAPSHYLNQCWLIISKVHWHSSEGNFAKDTSAINHYNQLENNFFQISIKSTWDPWVNNVALNPQMYIRKVHTIHSMIADWQRTAFHFSYSMYCF